MASLIFTGRERLGVTTMTNEEKAKIILEAMDSNGIQINWNMEKYYIAGIVKGLEAIELEQKSDSTSK